MRPNITIRNNILRIRALQNEVRRLNNSRSGGGGRAEVREGVDVGGWGGGEDLGGDGGEGYGDDGAEGGGGGAVHGFGGRSGNERGGLFVVPPDVLRGNRRADVLATC